MNAKTIIENAPAPPATPLFSQGVQGGGLIFTTQVGLLPSGEIVSDRIEDQTRQSLENIRAVLVRAGARLSDVVQMTIYLVDFADAPRRPLFVAVSNTLIGGVTFAYGGLGFVGDAVGVRPLVGLLGVLAAAGAVAAWWMPEASTGPGG